MNYDNSPGTWDEKHHQKTVWNQVSTGQVIQDFKNKWHTQKIYNFWDKVKWKMFKQVSSRSNSCGYTMIFSAPSTTVSCNKQHPERLLSSLRFWPTWIKPQMVNSWTKRSIQDIKNRITSWWFQPIWKILFKLDHFRQVGVKIKKCLKPPPRLLWEPTIFIFRCYFIHILGV